MHPHFFCHNCFYITKVHVFIYCRLSCLLPYINFISIPLHTEQLRRHLPSPFVNSPESDIDFRSASYQIMYSNFSTNLYRTNSKLSCRCLQQNLKGPLWHVPGIFGYCPLGTNPLIYLVIVHYRPTLWYIWSLSTSNQPSGIFGHCPLATSPLVYLIIVHYSNQPSGIFGHCPLATNPLVYLVIVH